MQYEYPTNTCITELCINALVSMHTCFGAVARHQMKGWAVLNADICTSIAAVCITRVEAVVAAQGAEHTAALTQVAAPSQHRDDEAMRIRAWTHSRRAIAPRRRRRRKCTVHLDHHPRIRSSTCKLFFPRLTREV